jgi:hypothetical protein
VTTWGIVVQSIEVTEQGVFHEPVIDNAIVERTRRSTDRSGEWLHLETFESSIDSGFDGVRRFVIDGASLRTSLKASLVETVHGFVRVTEESVRPIMALKSVR